MRGKEPARDRIVRKANKAFKSSDPKPLPTEYAKAQQSFQDNRERPKAERLAREAGAEEG